MMNEFQKLKKVITEDELDPEKEVTEEPAENVELDDIELEEPAEEIEDAEDKGKFTSMLQQSISEEYEASALYEKRAVKCEEHGMDDAAKLFRDIAKEEMVHVGEFQALMEKYGVSSPDAISQGEKEAEEIINSDAEVSEASGEITHVKEITQDKWDRTPDDYKMIKDGQKYMMYIDDESHMTVLGKVKIVDSNESVNEELEYAHNLEDRQKAVEEYKELRYQMMQAGASGTKPSPAMSKRSSELYRYLKDTEYLKEQNKTVNEEEFLDKGEIQSRIIRILDLTTEEDIKAINFLSDLVNFMDVDQLQNFYEFLQEEIDINYDEVFGNKTEESANESIHDYLGYAEFDMGDYDLQVYQDVVLSADVTKKNSNDIVTVFTGRTAQTLAEDLKQSFPNSTTPTAEEIDAAISSEGMDIDEDGTIASLGAAPTVVAGAEVVDPVESDCKELQDLKKVLKD